MDILPIQYLNRSNLWEKYSPSEYQQILDKLILENCLLFIKTSKGQHELKEPIYGTEYDEVKFT